MSRPVLQETEIHPAVHARVSNWQRSTVQEVQTAIAAHAVVVVGMGVNPYVKKARKALDAAGISHHYLEYGNYFGMWRERGALKMWTGWPTLPMVFVRGKLVGGATDLEKLVANGELASLLKS